MSTSENPVWHLWDRCGVELEYMIVDRNTLRVLPRVDAVLGKDEEGIFLSDVTHGKVGLSNELVSHVLEFKCAEPTTTLQGWSSLFHKEIQDANEKLGAIGAMLLPTACHPFMDPLRETQLWPYDCNEIYQAYDRIFNCKGHGWSNLQSTHLNLSFSGDEEFGNLHAAIRVLLPILPAIAATSPYLDGKYSGYRDARLETYRHNQEKIPSIAGEVIPEAVFTYADYDREIFERVREDIAPFDPDHLLNHFFLNSRGAIARFDRGAVEIRLVDIQECPAADIAIAELEIATLRALTEGVFGNPARLRTLKTEKLAVLLSRTIRDAEKAPLDYEDHLNAFGISSCGLHAGDLWKYIFKTIQDRLSEDSRRILSAMLSRGTLSSALYRALGEQPTREEFIREYGKLADCLAENRLYGTAET